MKKRFLSALVALSMIFSIMPNMSYSVFASSVAGSAGQSASSDGSSLTGPKDIIKDMTIVFNDGKVESLTATSGSDHQGNNPYYAVVYTSSIVYEEDESEGDTPINDTLSASHVAVANTGAYSLPMYHLQSGSDPDDAAENVNGPNQSISFVVDENKTGGRGAAKFDYVWTADFFNASGREWSRVANTATEFTNNDTINVTIVIASDNAGSSSYATMFAWETAIKMDGSRQSITIPTGGGTPSGDGISSFNVSLPIISLGSLLTTPSVTSDDVDITENTIKYNNNTTAPTVSLGTDYSITFSVEPSGTSTFDTDNLEPILTTSGGSYKAGYTPTIAVSNVTTTSADVTITIPKILIDDVTINPSTSLSKTYTSASPSYSITSTDKSAISAEVEFNYINTPTSVDYASIVGSSPDWISLDAANCSLSGDTVSITSDGATLKVNIDDNYLVDGFVGDDNKTVMTFNLQSTSITSGKVNLTYPVVGVSPNENATCTSADEFEIVPDNITNAQVSWEDGDGHDVSTFEYGKSYTATVVLQAKSGYAFDSGTTIKFADATPSSSEADVAPTKDTTTLTYSYTWTIPDLTITGTNTIDYYNTSATANVTVSNIGGSPTVSSVTLGGKSLAGADYSADSISSGSQTITINQSAIDSYLDGAKPNTITETTSAAARKLPVVITYSNGTATGTTTNGYVGVYNTTPYLTVTQPTNGGTISATSGSPTEVSATTTNPIETVYALSKTGTYTFTYNKGSLTHVTGTSWSGTGGSASGDTYTYTNPTDGARYTLTAEAATATGQTLVVTQPTEGGSISVTKSNGDPVEKDTSNNLLVYSDEQYKVTITAENTANKHFKVYPATDFSSAITVSNNTTQKAAYTVGADDNSATWEFSPDGGSNDVTITGALKERDYLTFKFDVSEGTGYDATYQADTSRQGGTITVDSSSVADLSTYSLKVYDDDTTTHSYSQTPKADSKADATTLWTSSKTGFTPVTDTITGTTVASLIATANDISAGDEITITANYTARTLPTITSGTADGATRTQSSITPADVTYTLSDGDYFKSSTPYTVTPAITVGTSGQVYTITGSSINDASTTGTYTVTFNYDDLPTGYADAALKRTFEIKGRAAVTAVGLTYADDPVVHGTNINTFYFDYQPAGESTATRYIYTSSSDTWSGTVPSEVRIKVNNDTEMTPAVFVDTYVHNNHVRYLANSTSGHLINGDIVKAYANSEMPPTTTVTVGRKEVTITPSYSDLNKPYDGDATVTDAISWTGDTFLTEDTVNTADVTVSGTYQALGSYAPKDVAYGASEATFTDATAIAKTVKFTAVPAANGTVADNYTYVVSPDGNGKILPKTLTISAITNIPNAKMNISSTKTKTGQTGTFPANVTTSDTAVNSETPGFTYDYTYANISAANPSYTGVSVSNIKSSDHNYVISPALLSNQSGVVEDPGVDSITVTAQPKLTYTYVTDDTASLVGMKVKVTYGSGTDTEDVVYAFDATNGWVPEGSSGYANIAYNDMPVTFTTGGAQITNGTTKVEPKDHSTGETLTVTYESKTATTDTLTVNTRALEVSGYTGAIERDYNGTNTFTQADGTLAFTFVSGKDILAADTSDVTVQYAGTFDDKNVKRDTDGSVLATKTATIISITLTGDKAGNYSITAAEGVTKANALNLTGKVKPINITLTSIKAPSINQGAPVLSGSETAVVTDGTGDNANGNGVTASGFISGDKIAIDYNWSYPDATGTGDRTDVALTGVQLTDRSTQENINYELTSTPTGLGHVNARTVTGISFKSGGHPKQENVQKTYGDTLDLSDIVVQVSYSVDGSSTEVDEYTWDSTNSTSSDNKWIYTPDGASTGVANTTAPFTFYWDGTTTEPHNDDVLTVAQDRKAIALGITGVAAPGKSDEFLVKPVEIDKIVINGLNDPYSVSKVYDGDDTVDTTGWSYELHFDKVQDSDNVTLDTNNLSVKYDNKNVHSNQNLRITGWALENSQDGNYVLADNITLEHKTEGTPDTYTTITPKGSITKRYIKVTSVGTIPSIEQYATDYATVKNVTPGVAATFGALTDAEAATVSTTAANTGIIESEQPYVTYSYKYKNNTSSGTGNYAEISNIAFYDGASNEYATVNGNYQLLGTTIDPYQGTITEVSPSDITVTPTAQMYKTGTAPDVQYGDILTMTGLTVAVKYTESKTKTFTLQADGTWKDDETTPNTYSANDENLPFTYAWSDSKTYGTDTALLDVGTFTYTAELRSAAAGATKDSDSAKLTVGPRKVTVVPAYISDSGTDKPITKVYDGNANYNGTKGTDYDISLTFDGGFNASSVTDAVALTADKIDVSGLKFYDNDNALEAKTVAAAKKVRFATSNFTISSDDNLNTKYTISSVNPATLDASITQRPLTLNKIEMVPSVDQYSDTTTAKGPATAKTNAGTGEPKAIFADATNDTGLVSGENVNVTFKYQYHTTDTSTTLGGYTTDGMTFTEVGLDDAPNYSLTTADPIEYTGTVAAVSRTIEASLPTQLRDSSAYYKDALNLAGMEVVVKLGGVNSVKYVATGTADNIKWDKFDYNTGTSTWNDTASDTGLTTVPFTIAWTNTSTTPGDISVTNNSSNTLAVDKHNGNTMTVTYGDATDVTDQTAKVNPLEITKIVATTGGVTKVYDGTTNFDNEGSTTNTNSMNSFAFWCTRTSANDTALTGDESTALKNKIESKSFSFANKNAGDNKVISFNSLVLDSSVENYKIASGAEKTVSGYGTITQKPVTITANVPVEYKNTSQTGDKSTPVTNATLGNSANEGQVSATGFITDGGVNEGSSLAYNYTYTYSENDIKNGTTEGAASVTISDTSVTGTGAGNYSYTWTSPRQGTVSDVTIEAVDPPTLPTNLKDHVFTHGDSLASALVGLSIPITTNSGSDTYTVKDFGESATTRYAWSTDDTTATELPLGVTVKAGNVPLTKNSDLNSAKAHYTNMGATGNIKVSITGGSHSAESSDSFTVNRKQLTATITSVSSDDNTTAKTFTKYYDTTTNLNATNIAGEGVELKTAFGAGEVQSFGEPDKVELTYTAAYENANAGESPNFTKQIKFTNLGLTGDDSANYIVPTSVADIDGEIHPFELTVTAIGSGVVPATYYTVAKSGTIESTNNYTSNIASTNTALYNARPNIKFTYDYGSLVNTVSSSVDVPIDTDKSGDGNDSTIELVGSTNFVLATTGNAVTAPGAVKGDIQSITITKGNYTKIYGEQLRESDLTATGNELTVTVKMGDGTDVTGITYGSPAWTNFGLTLDDSTALLVADSNTNVLRTTDTHQIKVKKESIESAGSEDHKVTVNKRPILLDVETASDLTMTYNGHETLSDLDVNTKHVALTLAAASSGTPYTGNTYENNTYTGNKTFYALADGDTLNYGTVTFQFADKNAGSNKDLTLQGPGVSISGTNSSEYAPELVKQTGNINKREITITPLYQTWQNANAVDGTNDFTVTKTNATDYEFTNIVEGEATAVKGLISAFSNTIKGSVLQTATTGYVSADTKSTYDSTPTFDTTGNYTVASDGWKPVKVYVQADTESIAVTTNPADLANQHYYGDALNLADMVVTVHKAGTDTVYTYDAAATNKWKKRVGAGAETDAVANEVQITVTGVNDSSVDKLFTAYNGLTLTAAVPFMTDLTNTTQGANNTLKVAKRPVYLVAEKKTGVDNLDKVYDGFSAVGDKIDIKQSTTITPETPNPNLALATYDGVTDEITVKDVSWHYYDDAATPAKSADVKGTAASPEAKNIGLDGTFGTSNYEIKHGTTDVSSEYSVKLGTPSLTGTINPYEWEATVNAVPSITSDETLPKEVTITNITYNKKTGMGDIPSDWTSAQEGITVKTTYTNALVTAADTNGNVANMTLTVTGESDNYKITWPSTVTGRVTDKQVTGIAITTDPTAADANSTLTLTHGDFLDLAGMVITINYDNSTSDTITKINASSDPDKADMWNVSVNSGTPVETATADLPVVLKLEKTGATTDELTNPAKQVKHTEDDGFAIRAYDNADANKKSEQVVNLVVNKAKITSVESDYAIKEGTTKYTWEEIVKPYDGNGTINSANQAKIAYNALAGLKSFDGTEDKVTIVSNDAGAASYKADAQSHYNAGDHKAIEIDPTKLILSTTASDDSANYELASEGSNPSFSLQSVDSGYSLFATTTITTSGKVEGKINKLNLTYTVKSVPGITTGSSDLTQTLGASNYELKTGSDTPVSSDNFAPVIKAHYANANQRDNVTFTQVADAAAATGDNYYPDMDMTAFPFVNYNITLEGTPTGAVTNRPVTGVAVDTNNIEVVHGDKLNLTGLKVTVKYSANAAEDKVYTYKPDPADTANATPWIVGDVAAATPERVAAPADVTVTWGTSAGASVAASHDTVTRLDDTNKGTLADAGNKAKTATVVVHPTTGTDATGTIKILPRQFTMTVTGQKTKVYDGTNTVADATGLTVTPGNLLAKTGSATGYDDVSVQAVTYTYDSVDGAVTTANAETGKHPALKVGEVTLTGADAQFYAAPAENLAETIINTTEGIITPRRVKVTDITAAISDSIGVVGGKLEAITDYDVSDEEGYNAVVTGQQIPIDVVYTYVNPNSLTTDVKFGNTHEQTKISDSAPAYKSNYIFDFAIPDKQVTRVQGEVSAITVDGPAKKQYNHGDKLDLTGTTISVTFGETGNSTKDVYTYNDADNTWTLTKFVNDVEDTDAKQTGVALPPELKLNLGTTAVNSSPETDADKTTVKFAHNGSAITATYTKDEASITSTPKDDDKLKVDPKVINVTVSVKEGEAISQVYDKPAALTEENLAKLAITPDADILEQLIPEDRETVTVSRGTLGASFVTEDASDTPVGIKLNSPYITLSDPDSYKINYIDEAEGTITKRPAKVIATAVPPYSEDIGPVVDIVSYRTEGFVGDYQPVVTWKGTYDLTSDPLTVDLTTQQTVDEDTLKNYDVTFEPATMEGRLSEKHAEEITIIKQPKFVEDAKEDKPEHSDKIEDIGDLEGFEIHVKYNDGTEEDFTYSGGTWNTTDEDGTLVPVEGNPPGTRIVWDNTNEDVSGDKPVIRNKENTITVVSDTNPEVKDTTEPIEVDKKSVVVRAAGAPTKMYDGTVAIPEDQAAAIIYTVEGVLEGDDVSATAVPVFNGEHVSVEGPKGILFTDVVLSGEDADNYTVVPADEITDTLGELIPRIMGTITPRPLVVDITAPTKSKSAKTEVSVSGVGTATSLTTKGRYALAEGSNTIIDGDEVTLSYTTSYVSTAKAADPADVVLPTDVAIDGVDEAVNDYTVTVNSITGKVTSGGGGGGGGGGGTTVKTTPTPTPTVEPTVEPTEKPSSGGTATPTPKPEYEKTDSLITKTMLNPYIIGYDDYVFGPELPISREELAAIFARLIANNMYMDQDYDTSFPDVPEKWSKAYIGYLEGFNVVTGYEDGTFRPENYITRAEMAVMMAKAEGYDISDYVGPDEIGFPDVDEGYCSWAGKAIKILSDMGIMEGYPDGSFKPGQPITRAETVATVNRVLADMEVANIEVLPSDVTDSHWAYNDIVFAMNHRILKDAAADPQKFIWSEQFDENIIVNTERVEGETKEVNSSGEEQDSSSEDSSQPDAVAPETEDTGTTDQAQTTN